MRRQTPVRAVVGRRTHRCSPEPHSPPLPQRHGVTGPIATPTDGIVLHSVQKADLISIFSSSYRRAVTERQKAAESARADYLLTLAA
jgi:hypothetical protein